MNIVIIIVIPTANIDSIIITIIVASITIILLFIAVKIANLPTFKVINFILLSNVFKIMIIIKVN